MTLYRRIPKNLWQKVWFLVKKPKGYDFAFCTHYLEGHLAARRKSTKPNDLEWMSYKEFEANYEPVIIKTSESGLKTKGDP